MGHAKQPCSGIFVDEARFGAEFRTVVDALFCACIAKMQGREERLHRELFRLVEIEGRPLAQAAGALDLGVPAAKRMLAKTRHDIAVLMALGLCLPGPERRESDRRNAGCRCSGASGPAARGQ